MIKAVEIKCLDSLRFFLDQGINPDKTGERGWKQKLLNNYHNLEAPMLDTLKKLILTIIILVFPFSLVAQATTKNIKSQEVYYYFGEKPLPLFTEELAKEGKSKKQIIRYLKEKYLKRVTPEFAEEKFKIKWLDNDIPTDTLARLSSKQTSKWPALVICYVGQSVGYGLFALDDIKHDNIIVQYMGKRIKDKSLCDDKNPYTAFLDDNGSMSFEMIDATLEGNAARFSNHLIPKEDLSFYQYRISGQLMTWNDVATANSRAVFVLGETDDDRYIVLVANQDIAMFEQIGWSYDAKYGYEFMPWPDDPYLFNKHGEIIPQEKYEVLEKGIIFKDQLSDTITLTPTRKSLVEEALSKIVNGYTWVRTSDRDIIIDRTVWEKQVLQPKNRIVVPSYFIPLTTDTMSFIDLLHKIDGYEIDEQTRGRILNLAKNNNYKKAEKLLESYVNQENTIISHHPEL